MEKHVTQYTLHLGDCLEVMPTIPDGSVDMILCDLPYGTTACAWDVVIPFEPLWKEYTRIIKKSGAIVLTASQPFTTDLINSNRGWFKYLWVWDKAQSGSFHLAKYQPLRVTEDVAVFASHTIKYKPIMHKGKARIKGGSKRTNEVMKGLGSNHITVSDTYYPSNILRFPNCKNKEMNAHPTQKPIELMRYLISTYTNEGDTVLDNCMGSGTTGVAAVQLGCKFIGIEKEPRYFDIAQRRLKEAVAQPDLFLAAI